MKPRNKRQGNEIAIANLSPIDHPLSVTQTAGLFPTDWHTLVTQRVKSVWPGLGKILLGDYNDPDSWLVIPEFGVQPQDVSYRGFDLLVPWRFDFMFTTDVKTIVKTARVLAQQQFGSLAELRLAAEAGESSSSDGAAFVYESTVGALCEALDWTLTDDDRLCALAEAASVIVDWMADGPAAAYARMRDGGRRGGLAAAAERRRTRQDMVDPSSVVKAAKAAGWPVRRWGINKELGREFGRTPERIGQILRAERRKFQNKGP